MEAESVDSEPRIARGQREASVPVRLSWGKGSTSGVAQPEVEG